MRGYKNFQPLNDGQLRDRDILQNKLKYMGFSWNFDFGCQEIHVLSVFKA